MALPLWITSLILIICVLLFSTLTIILTNRHLRIRFGPIPLLRFSWRLEDLQGASVFDGCVTSWGIHYTTNGWLFNVSGTQELHIRKYDTLLTFNQSLRSASISSLHIFLLSLVLSKRTDVDVLCRKNQEGSFMLGSDECDELCSQINRALTMQREAALLASSRPISSKQ